MNYIVLKQLLGRPYLSFVEDTRYTRSYDTHFYCVNSEDETKIHEVKALELFSDRHNHVLESVPHNEYWTINKLIWLLQSKEDSCFILYADIDCQRGWDMYTGKFLKNRDIPIYSIIRLDP